MEKVGRTHSGEKESALYPVDFFKWGCSRLDIGTS
jgi:hypothetical protein